MGTGIARPRFRITREQGSQIVARRKAGETRPSLAKDFDVSIATIDRVVGGEYRGWGKPPKPVRVLRVPAGRPRGGRLLTPGEVREIRQRRADGWKLKTIGTMLGISDSLVSRIANGLLYADVERQ